MPETVFDYKTLAPRVESALREVFPGDGVYLSEGYNGRVHVKIISAKFSKMSSAERQTYVYDALREKLAEDSQAVSLVSAYSPDDL